MLDVAHSRISGALHLGEVDVAVSLETRGQQHIADLSEALRAAGHGLIGACTRRGPEEHVPRPRRADSAGERLRGHRVTFMLPPSGSRYSRVSPTRAPSRAAPSGEFGEMTCRSPCAPSSREPSRSFSTSLGSSS